jgi:hypothetical protein
LLKFGANQKKIIDGSVELSNKKLSEFGFFFYGDNDTAFGKHLMMIINY